MRTGSDLFAAGRLLLAGAVLAALAAYHPALAAEAAAAEAPLAQAAETPSPSPAPMAMPAPTPSFSSGNTLVSAESQVREQAKETIKHIGSLTGDITLDDLNTARMTVAKIEAVIDIEKHLAELDKLRGEHETKPAALSASIPASALAPMPAPAAAPVIAQRPAPKHAQREEPGDDAQKAETQNTVSRIVGANGSYLAVIHAGGQDKTVRIGDHLPDGSAVVNITPSTVSLMRNGAVHQIKVEGIEVVYGRSY